MKTTAKYEPRAEHWTEDAYSDAVRYLRRRAQLVVALGPPLSAGDTVLDLACGDGGLGEPLLAAGLQYLGVDLSEAMVAAARRRLGARAQLFEADLNDFEPPGPVAATTCFRAIYYARDRAAFFRRVYRYTGTKLVFDLNPRQYRLDDVRRDLVAAGFPQLALHPFFVPQTRSLPAPMAALLERAERVRPLARVLLRLRFTYLCAAYR